MTHFTDEDKIERVAAVIKALAPFGTDADAFAIAAIAELKAIEAEEATPPAKTPPTMMDEARIPRTPERT